EVVMVGGMLVHGVWLGETYEAMTNMMRPMDEQEGLMHFMLIAHALMAAAFVWIYQRGQEDKPWMAQGLRFGVAIALLAPIPTFMIYYTVQQTPGMLAVQQSIGDSIVVVVLGVLVAFLNKAPEAVAEAPPSVETDSSADVN
ncbi:MAG: hypothetical protein IIA12_05025, partial [Proteobacteria bacterium]|nr:hypothetical protein [Pseudomonadota bacterium]